MLQGHRVDKHDAAKAPATSQAIASGRYILSPQASEDKDSFLSLLRFQAAGRRRVGGRMGEGKGKAGGRGETYLIVATTIVD